MKVEAMKITASERAALIRLASSLTPGSQERRAILAGLRVGPATLDSVLRVLEGMGDATASEITLELRADLGDVQRTLEALVDEGVVKSRGFGIYTLTGRRHKAGS